MSHGDLICDRETCEAVDSIDVGSFGNVAISSSDDFIANILHYKCKVVELARRQMQKEIPGFQDLVSNRGYLRIARGQNITKREKDEEQKNIIKFNEADETKKKKLEEKGATGSPQESSKVDEPSSPIAEHSSNRTNNLSESRTENQQNSLLRCLKRILTCNFPFYWLILVIGILALTSLVCGILLGAFICTNSKNTFPSFFWSKSRPSHAIY